MGLAAIQAHGPMNHTALDGGLKISLVVSTTPCTLVTGLIYNNSASTRYVHIFNLDAQPADTDVPHLPPLVVAAGTNVSLDVFTGVPFSEGLTIVSSSTAATLTASVAADLFIWATTR